MKQRWLLGLAVAESFTFDACCASIFHRLRVDEQQSRPVRFFGHVPALDCIMPVNFIEYAIFVPLFVVPEHRGVRR